MPASTMTSKYQATIPKPVREALDLGAGDRIEFVIDEQGVRLLKAAPRNLELSALEESLSPEWNSDEDEAAFADL